MYSMDASAYLDLRLGNYLRLWAGATIHHTQYFIFESTTNML